MQIFQMTSRCSASHFDIVWRRLFCLPRSSASIARFSTSRSSSANENIRAGGPGTKATEEQLIALKNKMSESVPKIFQTTHNFEDYHPNVIFEDNIRNIKTDGVFNYYRQLLAARWFCSFRYAKYTVTVLKITHDTQDSNISFRWTFEGIFTLQYLRYFIPSFRAGTAIPPSRVIDGFSIMYAGADGRVWKHVIEKMIPDTDSIFESKTSKPLMQTKIGDASLAVDPKS